MKRKKLSDEKLLDLIDRGMSQAQVARKLRVSRQAVNKRLIELRGKTTKVIMAKHPQQVVKNRFDAVEQLVEINRKALKLLEEAEKNPEFSLKCIAEVRNQIRLAADIQMHLFSVQEAQKFMSIVKESLREASPDAYKAFLRRINNEQALRTTLQFS
jgi:predicted transcriptional regulator